MDEVCRGIEILLNVLECYIFYKWISAFIKPKVKQNVIRLGLCLIFIVNTIKSLIYWQYGSSNFSNLSFLYLFIATFLFVQFLYQGKMYIKLLVYLGHQVLSV